MAHRLSAWAFALVCLHTAAAQEALIDPTRPPTAPAEAAGQAAAAGPVLQSVLLPRGGRPIAVISGVQVQLGGRYGDATVTRITESAVELAGPQGRQVLRLTPDAAKQPATRRAAGVPPRQP
jgi:MSHA biogenesis protein MshK